MPRNVPGQGGTREPHNPYSLLEKAAGREEARGAALGMSFAGGPMGAIAGVSEAAMQEDPSLLDIGIAGVAGAIPGIPAVTRKVTSFGQKRLKKLGEALDNKNKEYETVRNSVEDLRLEEMTRAREMQEQTSSLSNLEQQLGMAPDDIADTPVSQLAMRYRQVTGASAEAARTNAEETKALAAGFRENRMRLQEIQKSRPETLDELTRLQGERDEIVATMQRVSETEVGTTVNRSSGVAATARQAGDVPFDVTTKGSGAPLGDDLTVVDVDPEDFVSRIDDNVFFPRSDAELRRIAREGGEDAHQAQQMLTRQNRLFEFIEEGNAVSLPEVTVKSSGKVDFVNGRNRFFRARRTGARSIPVAVPKEEARKLK